MARNIPQLLVAHHQSTLTSLLASHPELAHLRVKKHGLSLILFSQDDTGPQNHVRFTQLAPSRWTLSFALHTGRWEATPFEDKLENLFTLVLEQFPFYLAPR